MIIHVLKALPATERTPLALVIASPALFACAPARVQLATRQVIWGFSLLRDTKRYSTCSKAFLRENNFHTETGITDLQGSFRHFDWGLTLMLQIIQI